MSKNRSKNIYSVYDNIAEKDVFTGSLTKCLKIALDNELSLSHIYLTNEKEGRRYIAFIGKVTYRFNLDLHGSIKRTILKFMRENNRYAEFHEM
jgi:hypothetical protein